MEWLKISTANELVRVATDDVLYVLADGNYSDLVLVSGAKHKMTFQIHYFEELFNRLTENPFVRVTRSLIINVHHVHVINVADRLKKFGGKTVNPSVPAIRLGRDSLKKLKDIMTSYGE